MYIDPDMTSHSRLGRHRQPTKESNYQLCSSREHKQQPLQNVKPAFKYQPGKLDKNLLIENQSEIAQLTTDSNDFSEGFRNIQVLLMMTVQKSEKKPSRFEN